MPEVLVAVGANDGFGPEKIILIAFCPATDQTELEKRIKKVARRCEWFDWWVILKGHREGSDVTIRDMTPVKTEGMPSDRFMREMPRDCLLMQEDGIILKFDCMHQARP